MAKHENSATALENNDLFVVFIAVSPFYRKSVEKENCFSFYHRMKFLARVIAKNIQILIKSILIVHNSFIYTKKKVEKKVDLSAKMVL